MAWQITNNLNKYELEGFRLFRLGYDPRDCIDVRSKSLLVADQSDAERKRRHHHGLRISSCSRTRHHERDEAPTRGYFGRVLVGPPVVVDRSSCGTEVASTSAPACDGAGCGFADGSCNASTRCAFECCHTERKRRRKGI